MKFPTGAKLGNIDQRYKGARNHASKLEKMICPKENRVSEYEKLFLEIKSKLEDIVKDEDEMNNQNTTTDKKEFGEEYSRDSVEDVSVTNEAESVAVDIPTELFFLYYNAKQPIMIIPMAMITIFCQRKKLLKSLSAFNMKERKPWS